MTEISKDIPLPGVEPKRRANYPWASLAVGESFFMENPDSAKAGCHYQGRKLDRVFIYERRTEEANGKRYAGARVWRQA